MNPVGYLVISGCSRHGSANAFLVRDQVAPPERCCAKWVHFSVSLSTGDIARLDVDLRELKRYVAEAAPPEPVSRQCRTMREIKDDAIAQAIFQNDGNRNRAAEQLQVNPRTIFRFLEERRLDATQEAPHA